MLHDLRRTMSIVWSSFLSGKHNSQRNGVFVPSSPQLLLTAPFKCQSEWIAGFAQSVIEIGCFITKFCRVRSKVNIVCRFGSLQRASCIESSISSSFIHFHTVREVDKQPLSSYLLRWRWNGDTQESIYFLKWFLPFTVFLCLVCLSWANGALDGVDVRCR